MSIQDDLSKKKPAPPTTPVNPAQIVASLDEAHRRKLIDECLISPEVIAARLYRSDPKSSAAAKYYYDRGWNNLGRAVARGGALRIPLYRIDGSTVPQLRPNVPLKDQERKRERKYENAEGVDIFPDVNPFIRERVLTTKEPIYATEGIPKADSAISHGLLALGLIGVWGFTDKTAHGDVKRLHADFDKIHLRDRLVRIAFDSDVMEKPEVASALALLQRLLIERGAIVERIIFPSGPNGEKVRFDDYFRNGGTVDGLDALVRDGSGAKLNLIQLSTVETKSVDWLWQYRIPKGVMTILGGAGGGGKTYLSLDIASSVTQGLRPKFDGRTDAPAEPGHVLLANFEDGHGNGISTIIKPRADACGVVAERLWVIESATDAAGKREQFGPQHVDQIRAALDKNPKIELIIIDPIMAFMGNADVNRDNEIREALFPLNELIAERNIACLLIAHVRKQDAESAIQRISGSSGFVNLARSVMMVAIDELVDPETKEPTGEKRRILATPKHNLCGESPALEYDIDAEGKFGWKGEINLKDIDVERVLSGKRAGSGSDSSKNPSPQQEQAETILKSMLREGSGEVMSAEFEKRCLSLGLSEKVQKKARKALSVESMQRRSGDGKVAGWVLIGPPY